MAVVNTKSSIVTGLDATPPTVSGSYINAGRLKESIAYVSVAAADDDGSVYRVHRVSSNMRLSELSVKNDAITGGTSYDIGIYQTAENGGAVVDANVFNQTAVIDMSSARDVYTELDQLTEEQGEQRLWELLGLSEDPNIQYDLCCTANTVGSAAGEIAIRLKYAA